jgi:hypothetical protein
VTPRLRKRIEHDFEPGSVERVLERLESLELGSATDRGRERIEAAIVILAAGDWYAFERAARDAELDWRDVLMAADLGFDDWPQRLDDALGVEGA